MSHGQHDVSNHRQLHCLFNHLFRRTSKKTSKLRVTGLCDRWPVDSSHKGPVTQNFFIFDDVSMIMDADGIALLEYSAFVLDVLRPVFYPTRHCAGSYQIIRHCSLKRACHLDDNFVTGCTENFHNDSYLCSQWWSIRQYDDILALKYYTIEHSNTQSVSVVEGLLYFVISILVLCALNHLGAPFCVVGPLCLADRMHGEFLCFLLLCA